MTDYPGTEKNRIRQAPKRVSYDRALVHAILDDGYVAHVAFIDGDTPVVIPLNYVRHGEDILLHGSRKSRIFRLLGQGVPLCLSVTHVDALVLARSAFHHSMNYRSVIIHSSGQILEGEEKAKALDALVEWFGKGRSDEARRANKSEDKATMVLRVPLVNVSAKIREGGPVDDDEDMALPVWAGVIPIETRLGEPVKD